MSYKKSQESTSVTKKETSQLITKECVRRLIKDIRYIIDNPLHEHGIYYKHDEEDMLKGYALIIGQEDTPYFGGFFLFEFKYSYDYPYTPPVLKYYTNANMIRFNPNLYVNGKVCLSILGTWYGSEQWSSTQSIKSILLSLITVFNDKPLINEPHINSNLLNDRNIKQITDDINVYNLILKYQSLNIAFCDILTKNTNIYTETTYKIIDMFEEEIHMSYQKNKVKITDIVHNEMINNSKTQQIGFKLYGMNTIINWKTLYNKVLELNLLPLNTNIKVSLDTYKETTKDIICEDTTKILP